MHSAAISARSALRPSRMYLKPFPSSPIRFSRGNFEIVEEKFVRLVIHHVGDRPNREPFPDRLAQIDKENRQPFGFLLDFRRAAWCARAGSSGRNAARARSTPSGRSRRSGRPSYRRRLDLGGVGAGGWLGDAHRLQAQFAASRFWAGIRASALPSRGAAACPCCTSARGRRRNCRPSG